MVNVKRASGGFTLVELMIVVAIIAILAAVALPAYQDFSIRTKISEAILALSGCRTSITEIYQSGVGAPGANNWGCEGGASTYVAGIATDANGVATVTLSSSIAAAVTGKKITLIPMINGTPADAVADMGKNITAWICGGSGTDLPANYLPSSCRGS